MPLLSPGLGCATSTVVPSPTLWRVTLDRCWHVPGPWIKNISCTLEGKLHVLIHHSLWLILSNITAMIEQSGYGTSDELHPAWCLLIKTMLVKKKRPRTYARITVTLCWPPFLIAMRDPLAETNTAHGKGVNGLTMTPDGRYLVSLGLDEKIRLWDTESGKNTFVNYGSSWRNRFKLHMEATVSSADVWPPLLYIPSDDRQVLVYRLLDGVLVQRLKGAYGRVICVEKRDAYQEYYSGSNGGEILVWEPPIQGDTLDIMEDVDLDAWSASETEDWIKCFGLKSNMERSRGNLSIGWKRSAVCKCDKCWHPIKLTRRSRK